MYMYIQFFILIQVEVKCVLCSRFIQDKFTVEVYQPYELLAATSESLKSSTAMLTDQSAARETFEKFDSVAANVTR